MAKVNLDSSSRVDIVCRKGDTFELTVDFGQSMSSYIENSGAFKMEVRTSDDNNSGNAVVSMEMAELNQDLFDKLFGEGTITLPACQHCP